MPKEIHLLRDQVTLVDDQDYDWLIPFNWRLNSHGYVIRSDYVAGRRTFVSMHRQIMNAQRGHVVDHIDHNKLNNTRANLRFVTQQQNLMSRRLFKNNLSGYKGVCLQNGRFHARMEVNQKAVNLGYFDDIELAALAYDAAARHVFGVFAVPNFPDADIPDAVRARVDAVLLKHGL
jgi:hypothetical protein